MHVNWRCDLCMLRVTCNEIVYFVLVLYRAHVMSFIGDMELSMIWMALSKRNITDVHKSLMV